MEIFFIVVIFIVLIFILLFVKENKKSGYAKQIYIELEKTSEGKKLKDVIQNHKSKVFRDKVMAMQSTILNAGYRTKAEPSVVSAEMLEMLDRLLKEREEVDH